MSGPVAFHDCVRAIDAAVIALRAGTDNALGIAAATLARVEPSYPRGGALLAACRKRDRAEVRRILVDLGGSADLPAA